MRTAFVQGFAAVFGLCFAASYLLAARVSEAQSELPPPGPAIVRLLFVDPNERDERHIRFTLDGAGSGGRAFAGFGARGKIEDFFAWSSPPGAATLRATVPGGSVERRLDLAPGPCRVVAVRSGDSVLLTTCLAPVRRSE